MKNALALNITVLIILTIKLGKYFFVFLQAKFSITEQKTD